MWGYKPIPNANTPDEEKPTLDEWARQQDKTPWLRSSTPSARGTDPGDEMEAVGGADAVKATTLGLKNLERVSNMLFAATTTEKGEPFDDLQEFYGRMLGQWAVEMSHVVNIVGGFNSVTKHVGQDGLLFTPVPRERQASAVKFLNDNAFVAPRLLIKPEILRRIEPVGIISRISSAQGSILAGVMDVSRLGRLIEQETMDGKGVYTAPELLADVRKGIFRELEGAGPVTIDAYRRNLQRSYVELMDSYLNRPAAAGPRREGGVSTADVRPLYRGELKTLRATVNAAMARAGDRLTRLHLEDLKDQIAKVLDPKFALPALATGPSMPVPTAGNSMPRVFDRLEQWANPKTCWPDYQIKQ
jgi:hypothetical protein